MTAGAMDLIEMEWGKTSVERLGSPQVASFSSHVATATTERGNICPCRMRFSLVSSNDVVINS